MTAPRALGGLLTVGVLAATAAGCASGPVLPEGSDAAVAASTTDSGLPVDPAVHLETDDSGELTQLGSADVEIGVVTLDAGELGAQPMAPNRWAIDFPAFTSDADRYPRAVVVVSNAGFDDQLDPAGRDFVWGADIHVDELSSGNAVDNGDNVVQRGISSDETFFKAELDDDRAACTATGRSGTLIVRANEFVRPGRWYRLRCSLAGDQLAVFVTELDADGTGRSYASRVDGRVGTIAFTDATIPLTVGGKVGDDGRVMRSATDQFNGLVANPFLAFGE